MRIREASSLISISQKINTNPTSRPWASEVFFPGGRANSGVFQKEPKGFSRGGKTGEISFFPLETKKATFFAKNIIGKRQIFQPWAPKPPWPLSRPMFKALTPTFFTHGQCAEFVCARQWGKVTFPPPFGREAYPEEAYIADLDAKSGASLKLTILNPHGRIWTMVAGGGASVVYRYIACVYAGLDFLVNLVLYPVGPVGRFRKPLAGFVRVFIVEMRHFVRKKMSKLSFTKITQKRLLLQVNFGPLCTTGVLFSLAVS